MSRVSAPITRGRMVRHEPHGYMFPAQLSGSANRVLPVRKSSMPIQSMRASFVRNDCSSGLRRMKNIASVTATAITGRLIQPIHRQLTYSLNSAPSMGPTMMDSKNTLLYSLMESIELDETGVRIDRGTANPQSGRWSGSICSTDPFYSGFDQ